MADNNAPGDDQNNDVTVLYLAVSIPAAMVVLIIVILALWIYMKRTSTKPVFKTTDKVSGLADYNTLNTRAFVGDYVKQNAVMIQPESVYSAPKSSNKGSVIKAKVYSKPAQNSTQQPNCQIQPVPFTTVANPLEVSQTKPSTEGFSAVYDQEHAQVNRTISQGVPDDNKTPKTTELLHQSKGGSATVQIDDGTVVIHVNNVSNPEVPSSSPRST